VTTDAAAVPWQAEMAAFDELDRTVPAPANPIVFTGSSTFTLWNAWLAADFAPLPVLGRGFGGSQFSDVLRDVERLILRHKPRVVVLYSGDNDIACGKKAEPVAADLEAIVTRTRTAQPRVRFVVCSIKPSPSRWTLWPEMARANELMRGYCERTPGLRYVDCVPPMLGAAGKPRPELFLGDMLHMNPQGYAIWRGILKPVLDAEAAKRS
jgi:lysophospholipase L1-like esterase